ncbi:hypothetical protein J6590_002790 [Homalodisca vitripennis]|nr:hypothetical protein J6590_002790 [Homalodisca vitripennis]
MSRNSVECHPTNLASGGIFTQHHRPTQIPPRCRTEDWITGVDLESRRPSDSRRAVAVPLCGGTGGTVAIAMEEDPLSVRCPYSAATSTLSADTAILVQFLLTLKVTRSILFFFDRISNESPRKINICLVFLPGMILNQLDDGEKKSTYFIGYSLQPSPVVLALPSLNIAAISVTQWVSDTGTYSFSSCFGLRALGILCTAVPTDDNATSTPVIVLTQYRRYFCHPVDDNATSTPVIVLTQYRRYFCHPWVSDTGTYSFSSCFGLCALGILCADVPTDDNATSTPVIVLTQYRRYFCHPWVSDTGTYSFSSCFGLRALGILCPAVPTDDNGTSTPVIVLTQYRRYFCHPVGVRSSHSTWALSSHLATLLLCSVVLIAVVSGRVQMAVLFRSTEWSLDVGSVKSSGYTVALFSGANRSSLGTSSNGSII